MYLLKRLSLRWKFLVAPAIALLLMAFLSTVLLLATQKQHEVLVEVEQVELHMTDQLIKLFSRLSAAHLRIYDLLVNLAPNQSEEEIYENGKPILYNIFAIEKEISSKNLVDVMTDNDRGHHADLIKELAAYRSNIISAVEMATVDRDLSIHHMDRATENYNKVNTQYLMLLDVIRGSVREKLVTMRHDINNRLSFSIAVFFMALLSTSVIAVFLSRLLTDDLSKLITIMGRVAAGEKNVDIPALSTSKEVDAIVNAVIVFKEILHRLETEVYERECAEDELQLAASVFEFSMEGIIITDADARIISVNKAFTDITGYSFDEAIGKTPRMLRSDHHHDDFYQNLWSSLERTGMWQGEIRNRRKTGEVFPAWCNISAVRDANNRVRRYIGIFTDITEKKLSEEHIHRLAHYDVLTDLPNRALFQERLEQALIVAKRHKRKAGILFLDLDRFKLVNDTLGHPAGDKLLQHVGRQLTSCVRMTDTVSRLGGDEFVIILSDLESSEGAAQIARKVLEVLAEPFQLDAHDVYVTASAGISLYPDDAEDAKDLCKNADTAMYRAKEQGKNTYRFYTEEMNMAVTERLALESQLRKAIDEEWLALHYQPRVDLETGHIVGMEALLRLQHPQLGTVSPAQFISIAEDTGLIIPIGKWVLRTACQQHQAWARQGLSVPQISINVSGRQFMDPKLVESINQIIDETGVAASDLELELTETFLMENPDNTIYILRELKSIGFNISIDDFGTAYSSLAYLKRFPVDRLKIDRSFIMDIPDDAEDIAITKAIIALARSLNLWIVAEGVETESQLSFLQAEGCQEVQGYYLSRPLDVDSATELLHKHQPFISLITQSRKISGIQGG